MSRRLALVVLAAGLVLQVAAGPALGLAVAASDVPDDGTPTLSTPTATVAGLLADTPTAEATAHETSTVAVEGAQTPTSTVDGLLDGGTESDETVDATVATAGDTVVRLVAKLDATGDDLEGAVSAGGSLDVGGVVDLEADLTAGATTDATTPSEAPRTATLAGAESTGTDVAVGPPPGGSGPSAGQPAAGDGLPVEPLVGGAVLGGAVVLGGLASRAAVTGGTTPRLGRLGAEVGRGVELRASDAAVSWRDHLDPLLGPFGYQRYDDSDPLEHEARSRLYERVSEEPGVHLAALVEATDLPPSTARYHLRVLEHEGLVRGRRLHGRRRFFPPDVDDESLAAALADEATAAVLRSLVAVGPASVTGLADRLDRDPSTVSHHLERLEAEGLVERERQGRAVVSSATPAVERAVARLDDQGRAAVEPRPAAASD